MEVVIALKTYGDYDKTPENLIKSMSENGIPAVCAESCREALRIAKNSKSIKIAILDANLSDCCADVVEETKKSACVIALFHEAFKTSLWKAKISGAHLLFSWNVANPDMSGLAAQSGAVLEHWDSDAKIILRKTAPEEKKDVLASGDIVLDKNAHTVTVEGKPVSLSFTEYCLLAYLMDFKEKPVCREDLLENAWPDFSGKSVRAVDSAVKKLRKKIGKKYIKTVRSVGYMFSTP